MDAFLEDSHNCLLRNYLYLTRDLVLQLTLVPLSVDVGQKLLMAIATYVRHAEGWAGLSRLQ